MALEPLAIGIRSHPCIKTVPVGASKALVSLYADDLLVTLMNPKEDIPHLFQYISSFGKISGYTINWAKSELMFIGENIVLQNCPVKIVHDYITYLGLKISKSPTSLLELNFLEAIDKLKSDIEYWTTLPLSMIGRVNAIKMVSLPKFLYLFQNLPIFISNYYFKKIETIILDFIWGYKKHRLSKKHLFRSTRDGGLGLPVFKHYYWAANAWALAYWQWGSPDHELLNSAPLWIKLELMSLLKPYASLSSLLFTNVTSTKSVSHSFIVRNSLKILIQIKNTYKVPNISIYTPVCHNHAFTPALLDRTFATWYTKGLKCLQDFYIDNTFASFDQLRDKYNLSKSHFFRYMQLRHFVRDNIPHYETKEKGHALLELFSMFPNRKKFISNFTIFFNKEPELALSIKRAWESEMSDVLPNEVWMMY